VDAFVSGARERWIQWFINMSKASSSNDNAFVTMVNERVDDVWLHVWIVINNRDTIIVNWINDDGTCFITANIIVFDIVEFAVFNAVAEAPNCRAKVRPAVGVFSRRIVPENNVGQVAVTIRCFNGKNKEKGIVCNGLKLKVVKIGENGITEDDLIVHDQHTDDPGLHSMLARMAPPMFPMAMGVIRAVKHETYNDALENLIKKKKETSPYKTADDLLTSGNIWEV